MKRLLSIFLAALMLLGVMPMNAFAEGSFEVTRVGQWTNESRTRQEEEIKQYNSVNDPIGKPIENGGLLRGLAKQFLAWSDEKPLDNGVLKEGAKLFSPEDTIADVFPNGVPADAKIYAVYYELNGFGAPFNDFQTASLGSAASKLSQNINNNKVMLNNDVQAEDILKGTDNFKVENTGDELKVIDYYAKDNTNEVVLKSEFEMDWLVAMLAYRNMIGSNQLRPILSRDYKERYDNNVFQTKEQVETELNKPKEERKIGFPITDGEEAGYTYVDLNMDFGNDDGLVTPEKLFLAFKSYSWKPLCAFGIKENGDKEVLNILGVDGSTKGNNPDAFNSLVSNKNPETKFGVETKGYRKITVRVVLRKWGGKDVGYQDNKILESDISKEPQGTIASEILSNMTLRVLGSADKIKNESIVRITDAKAKALADGEAKEDIDITGSIIGHVFADAGIFEKRVPFLGKITVPLKSDAEIKESIVKKPVKLSYVHKKEEPKPEPKPDNGGMWILPGSGKKEEATEDHIAYIFGYPDKSVRPEGNLTRAEAAAMVTRLGRLDLSDTSKADYPDLKDGAWYLPYINAALKAGMLDTDEAGNLRPDAPVTRGEFVKMIAAIDRPSDGKAPFTDIAGHKYEKEINQVYGNRRAMGYEDGSFKPDNTLTRAESAAFLNRVFNRVADDKALEGFEARLAKFTDLQKGTWFYYELVEATNSHQLVRRGGQDDLARDYERWTNLWYNKEAK